MPCPRTVREGKRAGAQVHKARPGDGGLCQPQREDSEVHRQDGGARAQQHAAAVCCDVWLRCQGGWRWHVACHWPGSASERHRQSQQQRQ
jgi:hypothetical protein